MEVGDRVILIDVNDESNRFNWKRGILKYYDKIDKYCEVLIDGKSVQEPFGARMVHKLGD